MCDGLSINGTAHVGTLVLTAPVRATSPTIGQVIGFHPPTTPAQKYTLRIVSIDDCSQAPTSRKDAHNSPRPWLRHLHDSSLVIATIAVPLFIRHLHASHNRASAGILGPS